MSKSEIQVLDFEKICRLCLLEKRSMSAIFSKKKSDKKVPLPVRIMSCASLQLYEGDGLPASICNKCLMSVNQSYAFREQCEQADTTLRQYAQRLTEANEEASTNNGEMKTENQKTASDRPLGSEGDITVRDGKDEKIDEDPMINKETGNYARFNKKISNEKRKKLLENVPKKKRLKLEPVNVNEWLDASLNENIQGEREESAKNDEKESLKDVKETSELGKFLNFYKPKDDDDKTEVKVEVTESEPGDENLDNTEENFEEEEHGKVQKSKKEEKVKKEGQPCLYRCEHCPKVYPSQGGLSYHRFIYHSAKYTPPVCDICGKTFRIQKYLESHKNTVHFKLKEHLCDLCGKDFSSKYGLKLHKIWHMGTKNFPCDVCGMRFSTIGKVNTHKQVHGGPKNYICEVCSRAFRWKKSLFTHMRTHSGERPYKCEHCDRTFSALWNMQQHVRIHTGERPYKCDVCGKAFALNASMKEHRNRHHKT